MREHEIHISICQWLAFALPSDSLVHHSPNEGRHHVAYRAKQKKLGVTAGWPDLEIFVPRSGWLDADAWSPIFFEVKTAKGQVSKNQGRVIKSLAAIGCYVSVVRSIDEARAVLVDLVKLNAS
tara:strand:+ start:888 stop:1256 length:369 start_codon:yes stop_codon:yes gene_type:complete